MALFLCVHECQRAREVTSVRECPCVCLLTPTALSFPVQGRMNDLYSFTPATSTWAMIQPSGSIPPPRDNHGFAAAPDGTLYVFGGYNDASGEWAEG